MTLSNLTKIIGDAINHARVEGVSVSDILDTLEGFQNELEEQLLKEE